jgi:hypothetical protein
MRTTITPFIVSRYASMMGRRVARVIVAVLSAAIVPCCSTYGRDDTTIVEVHDEASGADAPGADTPGDDAGDDATKNGDAPADALLDTGDDARASRHLAFLSAGTYAGSAVMGLAHADKICSDEAHSAGYAGSYKAWLSDTVTGPLGTFMEYGPWVRPDGKQVALDKPHLLSGVLEVSVSLTLAGASNPSDTAWTGTATNGTRSGNDCSGWVLIGSQGSTGNAVATDALWTNAATVQCNVPLHLYCFAQP